MQKLKSKAAEKLQLQNKFNNVKALLRNPAFKSGVASLLLVGLLAWLHIRPMALMWLLVFCYWFYKNRCNLCIQIAPELQQHIDKFEQSMVELRQTEPGLFCLLACASLLTVAFFGHILTVSTMVLACLTSAILLRIYRFKIIKVVTKKEEHTTYGAITQTECDEFLPEENETNMFVLERASDLASLTLPTDDDENDEDKSDEVPSELLIPDSIPEIDENSTDDDQDDLLPVVPVLKSESHLKNSSPAPDALVKFSQSNDAIEFKKGYFKRDSSLSTTSSSSEESLSKGLQFPDHTAVDGRAKNSIVAHSLTSTHQEANDMVAMAVRSQAQSLLANSGKLIPSLMSGLVQGVFGMGGSGSASASASDNIHDPSNRRIVTALDSSDESEFEILENEDF